LDIPKFVDISYRISRKPINTSDEEYVMPAPMHPDVDKMPLKPLHTENQEFNHWEYREEKSWKDFQFNQPYAKGLKRLKENVLANTNFDPATLWQWGTMQAMALISVLKEAEKAFGEEGQSLVLDAMKRVGYDVGRQAVEGTTIPRDMSDAEFVSYFATVMNRIAYASLESTEIKSEDAVSFDIDWCPHQDHYGAFDCRVQRYFVQGMLDAAHDFAREQGRDVTWDLAFETTIPSGAPTCRFEIYRGDPDKTRRWSAMTQMIEEKAIQRHIDAKNID
jgi:hypothetical protein